MTGRGVAVSISKWTCILLALAAAAGCRTAVDGGVCAEINLLSYNVCHCAGMDKKVDLARTAARIRAAQPDFVGLQEVDWRTARVDGVDEPAELARLTGLQATFAKTIFYAGGQYGVMILSRQKPLCVVKRPLPGKEPRVLLLCEFSDCWFGTTHLSVDGEQERIDSVAILREEVEKAARTKPVFLTGDWNSLPDSPVVRDIGSFMTLLSDTKCQTFHGHQVNGPDKRPLDMSTFCIDYIAVDRAHADVFAVADARVVDDRQSSDHAPVSVTVRTAMPSQPSPLEASVAANAISRASPRGRTADSFDIGAFGAKPDGTACTAAFRAAIAAAEAAGGGRVIVPSGEWETGPLRLKSNVELHLSEGAVLKFSDRIADYLPAAEVSWEGVECLNYSPLIYAYGATNVAITGKGTLAPKIDGWTPWFKREAPPQREAIRVLYKWSLGGTPLVERNLWKLDAHARPHLVHFNRCKGVRLEGFCIRESPFWCVHLYRSQDIVVRGLDISAMKQNNDGIDVEMSRNVMIENCHFNQGDDAIVLKAGRNREAYLTGEPTENVTIRNCTVDKALTFITIGSEMSGSVRHVRAQDCRAKVVDKIVHVKTNERRGGEVCDIDYRRIHCETARVAVVIQADAMYDEWKKIPSEDIALTAVHDIVLSDVTSGVVDFLGEIRGDARKPFGLILATGVRANHVRETQTWKIEHAPAFKEMVE